MTLEEIKREINFLDTEGLQELATWVSMVRRSKEPGRGQEIAEKLDSPSNKWVSLEELDQHLSD